jgi:hypothetical protein
VVTGDRREHCTSVCRFARMARAHVRPRIRPR